MRHSSIFMTVLLSLFIFQSIWNVAAAYCAHEQMIEPLTITTHFGQLGPQRMKISQQENGSFSTTLSSGEITATSS